nr:9787_t:CDS:2 [Entrophospora candida]
MSRIHGMFLTSHKSVVLGFISVRHIILDNDAYYYQSIDQDIQVHLYAYLLSFLEYTVREERIESTRQLILNPLNKDGSEVVILCETLIKEISNVKPLLCSEHKEAITLEIDFAQLIFNFNDAKTTTEKFQERYKTTSVKRREKTPKKLQQTQCLTELAADIFTPQAMKILESI